MLPALGIDPELELQTLSPEYADAVAQPVFASHCGSAEADPRRPDQAVSERHSATEVREHAPTGYMAAAGRQLGHRPATPQRLGSAPVSAGPTDGPWAQRDTALERIRQVGRREWEKESGYRQQARVENSFFRYKSVLGGGLKARPARHKGEKLRSGVTSSTGWPSWVGRNPALWCPEREVGKAPPLAPQLNHATAPCRSKDRLLRVFYASIIAWSSPTVPGTGQTQTYVRVMRLG